MPLLGDEFDTIRQLKEMNKNYVTDEQYRDLYSAVSLAEQRAASDLAYDYANAINQAYLSSKQNELAIDYSSVGQGYKSQLYEANRADLQSAYDEYRKNYMENAQSLANNYNTANENIYKAYASQEQYFANEMQNVEDYRRAHYDYIVNLFNNYAETNPEIFDNEYLNKFVVRDENGIVVSPITYEQFFTVDDEGYMTQEAVDLLSYVENILPDNAQSFSEYLYKENEDLFNWAENISGSYGDYGELSGGDVFKKLTGMSEGNYNRAGYDYRISDLTQPVKVGDDTKAKWETEFVHINSNNIIPNEWLSEGDIETLTDPDMTWKVSSDSYSPEAFVEQVASIVKGQSGKASKKAGSYVREAAEAALNKTLKEGTIVDINYGSGKDFYVYWNGRFAKLEGQLTEEAVERNIQRAEAEEQAAEEGQRYVDY